MAKAKKLKRERVSAWTRNYTCASRWDINGKCWTKVDNGPWKRDPGMDYGTTMGDLIIPTWAQDALKSSK